MRPTTFPNNARGARIPRGSTVGLHHFEAGIGSGKRTPNRTRKADPQLASGSPAKGTPTREGPAPAAAKNSEPQRRNARRRLATTLRAARRAARTPRHDAACRRRRDPPPLSRGRTHRDDARAWRDARSHAARRHARTDPAPTHLPTPPALPSAPEHEIAAGIAAICTFSRRGERRSFGRPRPTECTPVRAAPSPPRARLRARRQTLRPGSSRRQPASGG